MCWNCLSLSCYNCFTYVNVSFLGLLFLLKNFVSWAYFYVMQARNIKSLERHGDNDLKVWNGEREESASFSLKLFPSTLFLLNEWKIPWEDMVLLDKLLFRDFSRMKILFLCRSFLIDSVIIIREKVTQWHIALLAL